ncbi:MAG TPA: Gfo/Idh/MocA family oxidoreductase [Bryobacteraceae bacterium]|nr:Gfo/Idh/MocA family oxidoreductase [Bryobacteraceae bacterium]
MATRRDFLIRAAGAAAAVQTTRSSLAAREQKKFSANDKIRVAAIGLGIMGNKDCATALQVPGVELVAVCDLYTGRLEAAKEKYGHDISTTKEYRALLDRSDVDAVIIAACDRWHAAIAIEAMHNGKAVYCEKPMVKNIEEGLGVVHTQQQTGAHLQVGSQRVSSIAYAKARDQIRAGAIGQLNCISATYDRQSALGAWEYTMPLDASPATVDWPRYTADGPPIPYDNKKFFWWRNYREFGTGVAGDLFVHLISGVHFITGAKGPHRIFASGELAYWKDGRNVPDVMTAIMEYPETPEHPAFRLTLRVDFVSGQGERSSIQFIGSEGILDMGDNGFAIHRHLMSKAPGIGGWDSLDTYTKAMQAELKKRYNEKYSRSEQQEQTPAPITFTTAPGYDEHYEHVKNFFTALRGQGTIYEDASFGFRAAAAALACNKSYFDQSIVRWDPIKMQLV